MPSESLLPAPWYFRAVKNLTRRNTPGAWRLLGLMRNSGMLQKSAFYQLSETVGIEVPISKFTNCWDQTDLDEYEEDLVQSLSLAASSLEGPVTLVDGGADIGLFSLKVASRLPGIRNIVAFEPNAEAFPWLVRNLSRLPFDARAVPAALSDFDGRGELCFPDYDAESVHARYLAPREDGPVAVTSVDALDLPAPSELILKLDLEGGELAALRGARNTLSGVRRAVVVLEAHPSVCQRTGIDPTEFLSLLSSRRKFRFSIGETGGTISLDRPFFEQVPARVYNIVAVSEE